MIVVTIWTGATIKLMRTVALRCTQKELAELLGYSEDVVTKWERRGRAAELEGEYAAAMDTQLRRLDEEQRQRFAQALEESAPAPPVSVVPANQSLPSALVSPTDPAQWSEWVAMNRRELLWLFGGAAGLPVAAAVYGLAPDSLDRFDSGIRRRVDARSVQDITEIVARAFRQYESYGANIAWHTMRAQLGLVDKLLPSCPEHLMSRLLSARGALTRGLGWIAHDTGNTDTAADYYEQARRAAHQAGDTDLAAVVLCSMSWLETTNGQPRVGIDHAVAAMNWATKRPDHYLGAYCADMAAEAYANLGEDSECRSLLDRSQALTDTASGPSTHAYFYDPGLNASMRAGCLLKLGDGAAATTAAEQAVALVDDEFAMIRGYAMINLANAHTVLGHIDAAAETLTRACELAADCPSPPFTAEIRTARDNIDHVAPGSAVLRELDKALAATVLA
ncbi:hypothetical protein ACQP2U_42655 (plasmid) [Nocardia sp. CA-084685]|uniref:hypothetical protein n=1 Tax=Nocardia sp. CA-084685 TaxID=3239970 RepID=UPI003D963C37